MVDLRTVEVFYWSVRLGGFGRAAEKLHTTQPSVSMRIRQLEERYKIELFRRSAGQRSQLTPRGQELYALAERTLELDREIDGVLTSAQRLSGALRLGVSETVARTWLSDFLRALHRTHPDLSPDVSVDISATLREGLLRGELDLAILLGPLHMPRVREVPLCSYDLVWAAHPEFVVPSDLVELAGVPILTFARGTQPTQTIIDAFARAGLPKPRLFPNSALAATVRMAMDGIGVCVAPRVVIGEELLRGDLKSFELPLTLPPLEYIAAYIEAPQSAHLASIAAMAQDCAGHHDW
jgi:hypothetical protein